MIFYLNDLADQILHAGTLSIYSVLGFNSPRLATGYLIWIKRHEIGDYFLFFKYK